MSAGTAEALFDEYAARLARGEAPDPGPYLERAGTEAHELRGMLEALLEATPARPAPAERIALMEAWLAGEPPLLELRRRRGRRREGVVAAIMARFGLDEGRRTKVASYYHRLESGLLDLGPVHPGVIGAIAEALGVEREGLVIGRPRPPAVAAAAMHRAAGPVLAAAAAPAPAPAAGLDEVDRLFLGDPGTPAG